ncbi:MAG: response regulator transcription factor [Cytophagales bacterium]
MIKIILIEDNVVLTQPLVYSINSTQKYRVINTFISAEDALEKINDDIPDIVIMDIQLGGQMSGIDCTALLKKKFPEIDILILTVFEDSDYIFDALKAGACGYLTKTSSVTEIVNALELASNGGAPMSNKIARMVLNSFCKNTNSPLSEREESILSILSRGGSYKTAANEFNVSVDAIKYHIRNVYIKLEVNNKEDAISLARKNKWV